MRAIADTILLTDSGVGQTWTEVPLALTGGRQTARSSSALLRGSGRMAGQPRCRAGRAQGAHVLHGRGALRARVRVLAKQRAGLSGRRPASWWGDRMPVWTCIPSRLLCMAQILFMERKDMPRVSCSPAAQFICARAVQSFTIPTESDLGRRSP